MLCSAAGVLLRTELSHHHVQSLQGQLHDFDTTLLAVGWPRGASLPAAGGLRAPSIAAGMKPCSHVSMLPEPRVAQACDRQRRLYSGDLDPIRELAGAVWCFARRAAMPPSWACVTETGRGELACSQQQDWLATPSSSITSLSRPTAGGWQARPLISRSNFGVGRTGGSAQLCAGTWARSTRQVTCRGARHPDLRRLILTPRYARAACVVG